MSGDISPPRSKRRRLDDSTSDYATLLNSSITVYSWNVNGIAPFIQQSITSEGGKHHEPNASLRDFLRRHGWPTLLFLQEVKINPDDAATIRAVERAVRKPATGPSDAYDYEAHFCLPNDKYNARGFGRKDYGVCSIIRKDFKDQYVSKIRPVKWDAEGRFLVIETLPVGRLPKLALFNIYAVNGTELPYKDPSTGQTIGTRHDRKLEVHKLLQAECRDLEAFGFGIVLAGDINIARTQADGFPNLRTFPKQHCLNRADFETKFFEGEKSKQGEVTPDQHEGSEKRGLGMIDSFRHLHPDQRAYTYYPRSKIFGESCDRVDMIIVSSALESNIMEAGMHETQAERGPSDHVPLCARLSTGDGTE